MSKQIKRLTELSQCTHINKTDRDAVTWAIYQIQPPEVEPEKGFDGFDFSSWPSMPDKKVFKELSKSRRTIMSQAYIDLAGPHMHELNKLNISVCQALKVATMGGWVGFKSKWIINELKKDKEVLNIENDTPESWIERVKKKSVTRRGDIPQHIRMFIDTQFRLGNYPGEVITLLSEIGFSVN